MTCNLLLSYAFHATTDLAAIRKDLVCGLLMIDSGAFTAQSSGNPIDREAYAEFLTTWRGVYDHAVSLDVIGDAKATAANTHWLRNTKGIDVLPVFTTGMGLAEFDAMVKDAGYVCVGGLVGLPKKIQIARVKMLQRRALGQGGGIHALGIGSVSTLLASRPYSADASTVAGAFRYGLVVFFDGDRVRSISVSDNAALVKWRTQIRSHGIELASIARNRRLPNAEARVQLIKAMSLAYTCADEYLKRLAPVAAPARRAVGGPNLYAAVTTMQDAAPMAALDDMLHDGPSLYAATGAPGRRPGDKATEAHIMAEGSAALHGPHLYSSLEPNYAPIHAENDRELHDGPHLYEAMTFGGGDEAITPTIDTTHNRVREVPPIWAIHGRSHQCTPRRVPA